MGRFQKQVRDQAKDLRARLEPNDLIRALVYICLRHKRHPEHGDWLMGTQVEAEKFVVGFAFWRVDLHPPVSAGATLISYCLGVDDVVHVSVVLGRIRRGDNNTRQLHLYPWEISAWNGRKSGICPLMSKNDPNYTKSNIMTVYLHEILFMPISRELAEKFQDMLFTPGLHTTLATPPTTNALPAEDSPASTLSSLVGFQYPSQARMAKDFVTRKWRALKPPCGSTPSEQVAIARSAFRGSGAQCAQLCVMNLLDVITAQQKQTGAVRVSNYHVHMLRRLLHEHETSLHPQHVLDTFAAASDGQPGVDCDMAVCRLFSRASDSDVVLFWAFGSRIADLADVVVPDPWLQQPSLPHAFLV